MTDMFDKFIAELDLMASTIALMDPNDEELAESCSLEIEAFIQRCLLEIEWPMANYEADTVAIISIMAKKAGLPFHEIVEADLDKIVVYFRDKAILPTAAELNKLLAQ